MCFSLYGLSIATSSELASASSAEADLVWVHTSAPTLPTHSGLPVIGDRRKDGLWTQHFFASGNKVYCRFDISPDGRRVTSTCIPEMDEANVRELFSETVMRTILCRMGMVSFHAAALAKDGRAILLMGQKGAGKSTLAAALQQMGWTLLADDLVRIRHAEGLWHAVPGMRRNKLKTDVMIALGYNSAEARPRWSGLLPSESAAVLEEKLLFSSFSGEALGDSPLAAIFSLQSRSRAGEDAVAGSLSGALQVRTLAEHLTRDPIYPNHAPPPSTARALTSILQQVKVLRLRLPNSLADLFKATSVLEACLPARRDL